MFRAIHQANESSIVSLAPEWDDPSQLSALRQQCRSGEVCCPFCRSKVTLRAGEIKRRHFAHDARSKCPLANEHATRLAGRHLIYSWLVSRMPSGSVTLEEELPGVKLPSPVDVVCHLPELSIGYYFVHRNFRKPEDRVKIERALQQQGSPRLHAVVSADLVKFDPSGRSWMLLTPSIRELRKTSIVAWPHGFGNSLHLLNVNTEFLTTVREVRLVERPNCFQFGHRKESTLSDVDLKRDSGEMFHPGEDVEVQRRSEAMRRQLGYGFHHEKSRQSLASGPQISGHQGLRKFAADDNLTWRRQPDVPCEICGKLTPEDDQSVYFGATKTCHCRECMTR